MLAKSLLQDFRSPLRQIVASREVICKGTQRREAATKSRI